MEQVGEGERVPEQPLQAVGEKDFFRKASPAQTSSTYLLLEVARPPKIIYSTWK